MKKRIVAIIVMLILAASTVSFAGAEELYVPQQGYNLIHKVQPFVDLKLFRSPLPSEMFKKAIKYAFEEPEKVTITDNGGNDITEMFLSKYAKAYKEGNYLILWRYAKANIDSILLAESFPSERRFQAVSSKDYPVRGGNKTISVEGSKYFIDSSIRYGAERKTLELMLNIRGNYIENISTGKILSAKINHMWVKDIWFGPLWGAYSYGFYSHVVPAERSVLFIGSVDFCVCSVELPDEINYTKRLSARFIVFSE